MVLTLHTRKSTSNDYNVKYPRPMIYEKKKEYIKHDQLFKELIGHFFEEFLEAFFPKFHTHIDFGSIRPLSEELFTDLIDGENRRVDLVIEAKLKEQETLIIIHVEPQSTFQKNFHQRMFLYFSLLYQKYRKPILPIAVFSYDDMRSEESQFDIELLDFPVMTFNFLTLELKKKNWKDYLQSNNPVAAALLSKMGYKEEEKIQVKKEFLRLLVKMELDPARTRFIHDFFEQYLKLNEEEEAILMKEISQLDNAHEFTKLPNSWEEKGKKEGREEGKKEVALEMLKEGAPIQFIAKVTKLNHLEIERLKKSVVE